MKISFSARMAFNNICKNYRFYIPHVLTGTGLQACFYIMLTLSMDERLKEVKGGSILPLFMGVGVAVLALLSVILLFYTNGFLMKQRKREYGLYNVLGMEKQHVGRIMLFEMLISSAVSVVLGLALGIIFYKLCSLFICRLLQTDIVLGFYYIKGITLIPSAVFFILLYLLTYLLNRINLARMKPIELLHSKNVGEKEPKIKWALLVIGILALAGGYTLALSIKDPVIAITAFFAAVFLVVIGTYCLFMAGSVFVLKSLKKNNKIYYHPARMPAISGLIYRMSHNAVGLASIAILATGVLIMISSTVSLYSGMQGTLDKNYMQHMYVAASYTSHDGTDTQIPAENMEDIILSVSEEYGCKVKSVEEQDFFCANFVMRDGKLEYCTDAYTAELSDVTEICFLAEDMYESLTGDRIDLDQDEIAICRISSDLTNLLLQDDGIELNGITFCVKKHLVHFPIGTADSNILTCYGIVVRDYGTLEEVFGNSKPENIHRVAVTYEDLDAASEFGEEITREICYDVMDFAVTHNARDRGCSITIDSLWESRENILGMYGSFLFLGILLGLVCIFATVLIIYYKQISEGYEDRERFRIMKRIGMSDCEVKRTIRTQSLTVFFLPLITAGIHNIFAFPILNRMMQLLMLSSTRLYINCTIITFAAFTLIYFLIYRMTSKTYYKIVCL